MKPSVICFILGVIFWILGYLSTADPILRGIYSLPGFVVTIVSAIGIAFYWRWWLGVLVALGIAGGLIWVFRVM